MLEDLVKGAEGLRAEEVQESRAERVMEQGSSFWHAVMCA